MSSVALNASWASSEAETRNNMSIFIFVGVEVHGGDRLLRGSKYVGI
jgi:hypothetical protein